jgi:hypothetical protein
VPARALDAPEPAVDRIGDEAHRKCIAAFAEESRTGLQGNLRWPALDPAIELSRDDGADVARTSLG